MPFLLDLAATLADGVRGLDVERRGRHRAFLLSKRTADGGFRGRDAGATHGDLYYTGFAVRALSLLDGIDPPLAGDVGRFVLAHDPFALGVIDLTSWLYTAIVVQAAGGPDPFAESGNDWPDRLAAQLESTRTDDGGYAKSPEGAAGSTYHSFLVALTLELLGRGVPSPGRLVQFLYDRQRDDGGFVEIAPVRRSGTNPTAAAAVLLARLGYADEELRRDVAGFFGDVAAVDEGGVRANGRIPIADGLSTFTALLTCRELGLAPPVPPAAARRFAAEVLEQPTGGFGGAAWDPDADAEYTFYGLGLLGLTAPP